MEVSQNNISNNAINSTQNNQQALNPPVSTNTGTNIPVNQTVQKDVYGKFTDPNYNNAIPAIHVTSNFAKLRVFPDERNLYEVLQHKEAKKNHHKFHKEAAIGTAIGTIVPAILIFRHKFDIGKANYQVLKKITNNNSLKEYTKSNELSGKLLKLSKKTKSEVSETLIEFANELSENKISVDQLKSHLNHEIKALENTYVNDKKGDVSFARYLTKTDELSLMQVLIIGTGSIVGGLLGGIYKDKGEINKKKVKESNYQFINNLICPTILTERFVKWMKLDKKEYKEEIGTIKLPLGEKIKNLFSPQSWNNNIRNFCQRENLIKTGKGLAAVLGGVGIGITVGTKVANYVNSKFYKDEKYERKIGLFDVFIHVDDFPIALNFMKFPMMDKVLLFCLALCGYEGGKKE
jgi:gas vesicle protein